MIGPCSRRLCAICRLDVSVSKIQLYHRWAVAASYSCILTTTLVLRLSESFKLIKVGQLDCDCLSQEAAVLAPTTMIIPIWDPEIEPSYHDQHEGALCLPSQSSTFNVQTHPTSMNHRTPQHHDISPMTLMSPRVASMCYHSHEPALIFIMVSFQSPLKSNMVIAHIIFLQFLMANLIEVHVKLHMEVPKKAGKKNLKQQLRPLKVRMTIYHLLTDSPVKPSIHPQC